MAASKHVRTYVNTLPQCSPASVGLAQARLNNLLPRQHHCAREIWATFLDVAWVTDYIIYLHSQKFLTQLIATKCSVVDIVLELNHFYNNIGTVTDQSESLRAALVELMCGSPG